MDRDDVGVIEVRGDPGLPQELAHGDAVLGLIGTEKRLEYTAISDTVNTAKRLQENSSKNQIIISKETYERVKKQVEAKPLENLPVKGKSKTVEVLEVLGLK